MAHDEDLQGRRSRRILVGVDRGTLIFTGALGAVLVTWSSASKADVTSCIAAAEHAQPLRASGHLLEARAALITCAADSCPTTVRADCVTWLTDVGNEIPTVVVQAKSAAGEDLADVSVIVDGTPAKTSLDGLPISLDPGSHRLRFESPGRNPLEQTVILHQGERRVLSVVLDRPEEASSRAPRGGATSPAPTTNGSRPIPALSWVLGGASLVLAGSGIALWAIGKSEKSDLDDGCGRTSSCAHGDVVASRSKLIVGDVLVAAGVVALGAGVYFALSSKPAAPAIALAPNGVVALGHF